MNIIHNKIKIYNVQDRLDVVVNETITIEPLNDFPEGFEVLSTKDQVLSIADDDRTITTLKVGVSNLKFMTGDTVHKNLYLYVVDATTPAATTLNGNLGEAVEK